MKILTVEMISKLRNIKINDTLFAVLGGIIVFLCLLHNTQNMTIMYHLGDEFGYWLDAAQFMGYDWSGVGSLNTYYSFGYSLFLAPLLKISDYRIRYYIALLINILLLVGSYFEMAYLLRNITPVISRKTSVFISACVTLYSANVFFCKTTLVETLLYCCFVTLTVLIYTATQKPTIFKFVLIGVLASYIFMVHMRALSIVLSTICFLLVCLIILPEKRKYVITALIEMAILYIGAIFIKNYLVDTAYASNSSVAVNDFSGQTGKINMLFSLHGIFLFVRSFIGKVYYLLSSTFLLFGWGIIAIVKNIVSRIKKREMCGANIYFFIFFSVLFTMGVSSIYMMGESNVLDHLIYGRYNEYIVGPVIALGLIELLTSEKKLKKYLGVVFVYSITALIVSKIFSSIEDGSIRMVQIVGICRMAYNGETVIYDNWELCVFLQAILASAAIFLLSVNTKCRYVLCVGISALWITLGNWTLNEQVYYRERYMSNSQITDYIQDNHISQLLYVFNDNYVSFDKLLVDIIQYMNLELDIQYINIDSVNVDDENVILVRKGRFDNGYFDEMYEYVASSDVFELYVKK